MSEEEKAKRDIVETIFYDEEKGFGNKYENITMDACK